MPVEKISTEILLDVIQRLNIVEAVKNRLVNQPDPAAAKLVTVLAELSKIYGSMEGEMSTYLSLFFDDADSKELARERSSLSKLEGGEVRARMAAARGRCAKIWNIYNRYLAPWFQRVLSTDENQKLAELFRELSEIDSHMVDTIEEVATYLTNEARETGDLVASNNFLEANERVENARRELHPSRKRISEAMSQIRRLEGEFIEITGAV